jgi:hypothetical protein
LGGAAARAPEAAAEEGHPADVAAGQGGGAKVAQGDQREDQEGIEDTSVCRHRTQREAGPGTRTLQAPRRTQETIRGDLHERVHSEVTVIRKVEAGARKEKKVGRLEAGDIRYSLLKD